MMICYVRMIHNDGEDKNMTDDDLKALVASLAVDSKNLHEAQHVESFGLFNDTSDYKLYGYGISLNVIAW